MNSTTINFRIDQVLKDELQEIADDKGVKISLLIREIITNYIDNYDSYVIKTHKVVLQVPSNYNPNY